MAQLEEVAIRRRVSYAQLRGLCEFLNSHRKLVAGFNKSTPARHYSRKMWQTVAQILNAKGEGAVKTWKGWSTYWVDYKAKLKRKCANIRRARSEDGAWPLSAHHLTEVDKKLIELLGFGAGLPEGCIDQFENCAEREQAGDSESAIQDQNQSEGNHGTNLMHHFAAKHRHIYNKVRKATLQELENFNIDDIQNDDDLRATSENSNLEDAFNDDDDEVTRCENVKLELVTEDHMPEKEIELPPPQKKQKPVNRIVSKSVTGKFCRPYLYPVNKVIDSSNERLVPSLAQKDYT